VPGVADLVDALPIGIVVQDVEGRPLEANRAAEALLGLSLADMQDLPGRAPQWRAWRRDGTPMRLSEQASVVALRSGEAQRDTVMGLDGPDGRRRWLQTESVPFFGDGGELAGVITSFVDVTSRVEGEDRLQLALAAAHMATWDWHVTGDGTFGCAYDDFLALVHPDDREFVARSIAEAAAGKGEYELDFRILDAHGDVRWITGAGRVIRSSGGEPIRFVGLGADITDRKVAELEREATERRLSFLAQATSVLASSLDYEATLSRLAHLAVPFLADWCGVDVLEDEGSIRRVAVAYADPDQAEVAQRLATPPDPHWRSGVPEVIRSGKSVVMPDLDHADLGALARDQGRVDVYGELGLHSMLIMPLIARGRTLGAIWFALAESPRSYDRVDADLAQELARRAALAVDNARLYRERTRVARTLQASLLPPHLPDIPGLEVAARYRAAGEGNDIGGDFYDVFEAAANSWAVVIGDVCGKGTEAAALTGLARHTLRAAAMQERDPSRVLQLLNEAVLRSGEDERFCTAAFGRLDPSARGARLTLASGGHPLPLVLRADGSVRTVGRPGTLIGALPYPRLVDRTVDLGPGDAVVFCTDGVMDATGPDGFYGLERLKSLVAASAGLDADALAERIERDVLDFQHDRLRDDLAILVVRVPDAAA